MVSSYDLQFFSVLSEATSLAAASRALGVSPSAVTQRLRSLESRVGVRLVDRSSRRLQLTAEGHLLAAQGTAVLAQIDALTENLGRRRDAVTGHLRVAAPFGFGRRYVAQVMERLRTAYPQVELTLSLFDDPGHLQSESWDVLVHVGPLTDSTMTMVRLAPNRRVLCAAPSYIERHGLPESPTDLRAHICAVIRENRDDATLWSFRNAEEAAVTVRIQPAMSSNDGEVIKQWVLAGLGITVRSEWDVSEELNTGRLVELLPDWRLPDVDVVALLASRSGRVARTDRFLEFVKAALQPPPWRSTVARSR
ncbi:MAG TPA: LysR family transcriptional regulator [Acidisoma sp.]|jgi:DNA-binding transcriptional LysR family regulator|uniref:LysR family transcriptional regulator n=1 Tax=Acidisoma sp. TaxID=1872115 RepID=UPI002CC419CD|nr:LysR family transcriptional regulator [Acidisoma sp.]HTI01958.1 LysR family transcriptional regulator [Acidisoma sp.]